MNKKVSCFECDLAELCIPLGLDKEELGSLDAIVQQGKKTAKKSYIYGTGDAFSALYAVHSGAVKTVIITADGKEQITGFFLPGEIFGMDGLATHQHQCAAIALQDCSFCRLPIDNLDLLSNSLPRLRRRITTLLGQQISSGQDMMVLLGKKNAEERITSFLLGLSIRNKRYDFSESEIKLSMSREDIANFLGLTIETVSRTLAGLQRQALLDYKGRFIHLKDIDALKKRISSCTGNAQ